MSIEQRLRAFIVSELRASVPPADLTDDFPLLKNYVIESMGIFLLVGFMEEQLGIEVLDEEVVPQHFESIEAMARFVRSKLPADRSFPT